MKLKNVSFVQRHIEKIVLGICSVFGLMVVISYVLSGPYHVDLRIDGQIKTAMPDEVQDLVVGRAVKLENDVMSRTTDLPDMPIPDYTRRFREELTKPLVAQKKLDTPLSWMGLGTEIYEDVESYTPIYELAAAPAPDSLHARAGFGVLAELEDPELQGKFLSLVGDRQPRDFHYVSVSAQFDMEKWRQLLRKPREEVRIPDSWWSGLLAITEVVLERRTKDLMTGEWGPIETIAHLPNQTVFSSGARQWTAQEGNELLRQILFFQDQVTRPEFVKLAAGQPWMPPDAEARLSEQDRQRLREIEQKIEMLRHQLERLGPATSDAAMDPSGFADPNMTPPAPTDRGGRAGQRPRTQSSRGGSTLTHGQIQQQIDELLRERNTLLGVRPQGAAGGQAPGMDETGFPMNEGRWPERGAAQPGRNVGRGGRPVAASNDPQVRDEEQTLEKVAIWAHDLTARPGQIYQYRLRVKVINPLFLKDLNEEQIHLRDALSWASEPSAWSKEVSIEPEFRYFLAGANKTGRSITMEVYRIFNGRWQMQQFTVSPGDLVGQVVPMTLGETSVEMNMDIQAVVVDVDFESPVNKGLVRSTVKATIMDVVTGTLYERTLDQDRDSPIRSLLRNEVALGSTAAALK